MKGGSMDMWLPALLGNYDRPTRTNQPTDRLIYGVKGKLHTLPKVFNSNGTIIFVFFRLHLYITYYLLGTYFSKAYAKTRIPDAWMFSERNRFRPVSLSLTLWLMRKKACSVSGNLQPMVKRKISAPSGWLDIRHPEFGFRALQKKQRLFLSKFSDRLFSFMTETLTSAEGMNNQKSIFTHTL